MALYSKVDRRIWIDTKFRALSQDAKILWFYLLTCPENSSMPGLLRIGKAALAEALEWFPERLPKPFAELTRNGMAKADWEARFVYLPNSLRYNAPPNPNVVSSWSDHWDNLPECDLKNEAFEAFSSEMKRLGEPFAKRFAERLSKPSALGIRIQEQEQDQDQEQEILHAAQAPVPTPPDESPVSKTKPKRTRRPVTEQDPSYPQVVATWFQLFEKHKGAKPVFNGGKDGRHVKALLEAFGGDIGKITNVFENAFADAWWAKNRATLADLASNPNRFLTAPLPGSQRQRGAYPVQTGNGGLQYLNDLNSGKLGDSANQEIEAVDDF